MIFDVAGATAEMAVERLGNGLLKVGARHAPLRQPFEQHLSFVEKTRGAIPALKGEMLDEGFLQDRSSPFLAWPSTVRIDLPLKLAAETMQVGLV
jgi:hypothetical protein